eukprot:4899213-Pleurochrysis_carterae.AAC.2
MKRSSCMGGRQCAISACRWTRRILQEEADEQCGISGRCVSVCAVRLYMGAQSTGKGRGFAGGDGLRMCAHPLSISLRSTV